LTVILFLLVLFHGGLGQHFYQSMSVTQCHAQGRPACPKNRSFSTVYYRGSRKYLFQGFMPQGYIGWELVGGARFDKRKDAFAPNLNSKWLAPILENPGYDLIQIGQTHSFLGVGGPGIEHRLFRYDMFSDFLDFQLHYSESQLYPLERVAIIPFLQQLVLTGPLPLLWDYTTMKVLKRSHSSNDFKNIHCIDGSTCIGLHSINMLMHRINISSRSYITTSVYQPAANQQYQQMVFLPKLNCLIGVQKRKLAFHNIVGQKLVAEVGLPDSFLMNGKFSFGEQGGRYFLLAGAQTNGFWTLSMPSTGTVSDVTALFTSIPVPPGVNASRGVAASFFEAPFSVAAGFHDSTSIYYLERRDCDKSCMSCTGSGRSECLTCYPGSFFDRYTSGCQPCKAGCKRCTSENDCVDREDAKDDL